MTESKANSDFVVSFYAVLRSNDLEAWLANFAPAAIAHVPVGAPSHYGHTRLRNFLSAPWLSSRRSGWRRPMCFMYRKLQP